MRGQVLPWTPSRQFKNNLVLGILQVNMMVLTLNMLAVPDFSLMSTTGTVTHLHQCGTFDLPCIRPSEIGTRALHPT
jgi:hypothetical protein